MRENVENLYMKKCYKKEKVLKLHMSNKREFNCI